MGGVDLGSRWHVVTASVRGPNHTSLGLPNQDSFRVSQLENGLTMFAVADGAGSRERSAEGSACATEAADGSVRHVFGGALPTNSTDWQQAMTSFAHLTLARFDDAVQARIRDAEQTSALADAPGPAATDRAAAALAATRGQYATTLLAVVAMPPWYGYVSVGDCFLVLDRHAHGPHLVVGNDSDREHAGASVFLTSAHRSGYLQTEIVLDDQITGLALCTDGLYEGMLSLRGGAGDAIHKVAPAEFRVYFEHFASTGSDPNDLARKLASKEFAATSGDDKTMILAVRRR
jgi:serine/threonine protein phosphatase PrpC